MKPGFRLATFLIVVAAAVAACGGSSDETSRDEPAATRVEVTAESGSIRITGDDGADDVNIVTTRHWNTAAPEIVTERDGDVLRIFHECADGDSGCAVDYSLTVPSATAVVATATSGNVIVISITGDTTLTTTSGDITATAVAGALQATTGDGGILGINLTAASGAVTTASGRIDISWDEPVEDLTVESESGDITVQVPGQPYAVAATSGSGDVDVRIEADPGDAKSLSITSASGSIRIYAG